MTKLNAKELRDSQPSEEDLKKIKRNPITIIIDNVLDSYNIGAIFRLADAVSAEKVYLCGSTETPPYHKIQKASVGTWQWIPWEYAKTAREAVMKVRSENKKACPEHIRQAQCKRSRRVKIIAVEQHPKSVSYTKIDYTFPIALIVGHETTGVSKEALKLADYIAEIPMFGVNRSLNVMVSLAIILYKAMEQIKA